MSRKNDDCLPHDYVRADASFDRAMYHIVIPRKFGLEDCLDPSFWRYQTRIRTGDVLDLLGEAGDFDVTARCISSDRGFCILRVLRRWTSSDEPQQSSLTGEAHVALVPSQGWTLFGADGSPIARFGDEDSARKALAELPAVPATAEAA